MPDELLRPTIGAGVDLSVRPWRLMSQAYVAFFGGVIAGTAIAWLNAGRLGVDVAKRRLILLTGLVGLVAVTVMFAVLDGSPELTAGLRISNRVVAVLACILQLRLQRPMDRAFQLRGTDYGSLWGPGIAVTVGGAVVEAVLLLAVGRIW